MSKLRFVRTKFWTDPFITGLSGNGKLLFLYFLTNPFTNIAGVYEISLRQIAFDTGLKEAEIKKQIELFERKDKLYFRSNYVVIRNFQKNQKIAPTIQKAMDEINANLPIGIKDFLDTLCIGYAYPMHNKKMNMNKNIEEEKKDTASFQDAVSLTEIFYANLPDNLKDRYEKYRDKWIDSLEKSIRLDKYSFEKIKNIIIYFRNDDFWSGNFMSPLKLRKLNRDGIKYIDFFWNKLNTKKHPDSVNPGKQVEAATKKEIMERIDSFENIFHRSKKTLDEYPDRNMVAQYKKLKLRLQDLDFKEE